MASKYLYRLNPRHHRLDQHTELGVTVSHTPMELTAEQSKRLLQSTYRGIPLIVQVPKDADDPVAAAEEAAAEGDAEAAEAAEEAADNAE